MNDLFSVILVEPQGDANIGATARAMKNFGIEDLRLVNPVEHLTKPAYMWAVEAKNVLESAKSYPNLEEATKDSTFTVAFTRRIGKLRKKHMDIREAAKSIVKKSTHGKVALVFGREDKGLSNAQISHCDMVVQVPTSKLLPSLNLAQAVLLICYEIFNNFNMIPTEPTHEFIQKKDVKTILKRMNLMLENLDYEDTPSDPLRSKITKQFEGIFGRSGLTSKDVKMLEGLTQRVMGRTKIA